jgi:hypothetical protein
MKRLRSDVHSPVRYTGSDDETAENGPGKRMPLDADSAGQRAVELLTSVHPRQLSFALLLDDMHAQGIHTLKICNAKLSADAYKVLVGALTPEHRLRDQIRELDFSGSEFTTITDLLNTIRSNHCGRLLSLRFADTHFAPACGQGNTDASRPIALQPHHIKLILDIVEASPDLTTLDLSGQEFMGRNVGRIEGQRNAPTDRLTRILPNTRIASLSLRNCRLSHPDMDDIAAMLCEARQSGGTSSLRELHLQDNDPLGTYAYLDFLESLNQHPSLECLGLADAAQGAFNACSDERKHTLAHCVRGCPELRRLEPQGLADAECLKEILDSRNPQMRNAALMISLPSVSVAMPEASKDKRQASV